MFIGGGNGSRKHTCMDVPGICKRKKDFGNEVSWKAFRVTAEALSTKGAWIPEIFSFFRNIPVSRHLLK